MGLEAASVVVFMAASQGVDRRATNEDAIEAAISLMRSHLQKNIIPALCQTHHSLESDKTTTSESSPSKRRRVATSGQANISKSLKPVYALILPTISAQILLVERLENLVRHIPLDDQQILMLTNPAIMVLEIDCNLLSPSSKSVSPAMVLQKTYTSLVTEAFRRYKLHRETILEDLFPIMLKLPTAKRSLRAFQISYAGVASPESFASFHAALLKDLLPNAAQPHCIQMITAMLLSLIQACVTRPNYEGADEEQDGQGNEGDDNKPAPVFVNGLQEAKMVVDVFCTQLLSRCSKKGCVLEFRPVLVNLVEDLLLCFMLPEYPAAELLLSRLLTLLTIDMKRSSASSKSKQTLETTYLNTAFDLVGKIGAVQARILSVHRDKALTVTNLATPMPMNEDDHVRMGCYCGDTSHEGRFALECDHCRVTFHGGCINYDNGTRDEEWFCDACKLGRLGEREKLKYKANGEELYVDDQYVLYQSFFSLLSHREGGTLKELQDATQMHLSRWAAFLNVQSQKLANKGTFAKPLRITHDLMNFWESPGPGAEPLSDEGTNRLILSLAVGTSQMLQCFHAQISIILQLMGDGSHTLRKLSLKAIEKVSLQCCDFVSFLLVLSFSLS
jgi:cohesin loading factor subunit SCC2